MSDRNPNTKVTLTLRIPEWLRDRLVLAAGDNNSLNTEIIQRLERSFKPSFKADAVRTQLDRIEKRLEKLDRIERAVTPAPVPETMPVFSGGLYPNKYNSQMANWPAGHPALRL